MPAASDPRFLTHHALRIKGFAQASAVAELSDQPLASVEEHLAAMRDAGHANFRDLKGLWQITPEGRTAHAPLLSVDLDGVAVDSLGRPYTDFLAHNHALKELCTAWQLRDGEPNDHADARYDALVIDRLVQLHSDVVPVIEEITVIVGRFAPYPRRLAAACQAVVGGHSHRFTGVMCGSYHDIWMELHEDLILTQGIDRSREGSF